MVFTVQPESPPLHEDETGGLRVGRSRVSFEIVIRAFQDGATPEAIVQRYSTLSLPDVYAAIAYYLRHTDEVAAYLAWRENEARELQQGLEQQQPDLGDIRARLLSRRHEPAVLRDTDG